MKEFVHSCTSRLASSHMVLKVEFLVPPEQSPKITSFRAVIPDGSGVWMVSPDGSFMGPGVGREVNVDKSDRQCLTGGFWAARASALDLRSGMR